MISRIAAGKKIKPSILGGLQCNDFILLDGNNDTLIYIEKFKLQTSNFSLKRFNKVYIQLSKITHFSLHS